MRVLSQKRLPHSFLVERDSSKKVAIGLSKWLPYWCLGTISDTAIFQPPFLSEKVLRY